MITAAIQGSVPSLGKTAYPPRSWRPVRGRRAVAQETGGRDAPKSASQEDAKVRRLREGRSDPGPDAIRQAYRHAATAGLRPDPPVGACLHANTSGDHRRAVFAAKAAPTKPAGRLARSAQRNAPFTRAGAVRGPRPRPWRVGPFVSWEETFAHLIGLFPGSRYRWNRAEWKPPSHARSRRSWPGPGGSRDSTGLSPAAAHVSPEPVPGSVTGTAKTGRPWPAYSALPSRLRGLSAEQAPAAAHATPLGDCRRFSYPNAPDSAPYARHVNPHVVALRKGWRNAADGVEGKQAGMKMDRNRLSHPSPGYGSPADP